jgi:hypothetical protein
LGNPFRFGSFDPNAGAESGARFPRPDPELPPQRDEGIPLPRPQPERKSKYHPRPASTTLSDTDSDREKELEHMRIRMASLENEVRRKDEEKQRVEKELARMHAQQQQPHLPPQPGLPAHTPPQQPNGRTPEQMAARELVHQFSRNGHHSAQNDTQSTMTGLANQFGNMNVNHVHEVSQILAQNATATNANKPVERLHLTNSEDQHIKMIAQQVERDEQHYNSQVQHIAAMRMMQQSSGMDMSSVINPAMAQAQDMAIQLQRSKEQMEKVKTLSRVFNAEIPLPVIKLPPPGVHRRGDGPNLKYIEKRVPVFDPEKDANACFKIFMEDLNEIAHEQYFTEGDWRALFDCLLRGEPRYEYKQCLRNGKSFQDIVKHLGKMYTKKKSIEDEQREVDNFTRKPKEELIKAMSRYETQISKLRYLYDDHIFPSILQSKLEQGLMAMVSAKTKQHLVMKNTEALLTGAPLQFEDLLKQAEKFEKTYNEIPTLQQSISANTADLQKTITAQSSKIADLMKKNPNHNDDISYKLDEILSVTSAHFKRDKSAERKTAASKPAYRSSSGSRPAKSSTDVEMTDVSTNPSQYLDKTNRADKKVLTDEKSKREKERLRKMYEEKKKAGLIPQKNQGYNNDSRGRTSTPGRSGEPRSSSNSSQKSGGSQSRSNSANKDNSHAHTEVKVDIWSEANCLTCTLCTLQHPPYRECCPAPGNM